MSEQIPEYQQRVLDENEELNTFLNRTKERIEKLEKFINGPNFINIVKDEEERRRLSIQYSAMSRMMIEGDLYNYIMNERIQMFKQ